MTMHGPHRTLLPLSLLSPPPPLPALRRRLPHPAAACPRAASLLLADEATTSTIAQTALAHAWLFDVREPTNPVSFATTPSNPSEADYSRRRRQIRPPQPAREPPRRCSKAKPLIFATWHNAGVRACSTSSNPFQPQAKSGSCRSRRRRSAWSTSAPAPCAVTSILRRAAWTPMAWLYVTDYQTPGSPCFQFHGT